VFGARARRYSLVIGPQRLESDPALADLHAYLLAHGRDQLTIDAWLASDHSLLWFRERSVASERALRDGLTEVADATREFWDYGVSVNLTAPAPEQVLRVPG
jgi:hypothetical protein